MDAKVLRPRNFCDGVYSSNDGTFRKADGLSVRLTAHCDNDCSFCIAHDDMKNIRPVDVEAMVAAVRKTGSKSLQILGGEPLLFLEDCLEFVKGVEDQIEYMFFTTSLPYTIVTQWDKFQDLMSRTQSLSVSIQSTDWQENNRILKAKKWFNRIELLERIVKEYGDKVTVIINLVKGGIDTEEKLWNTLDDLNDIGVSRVRINELQKAGSYYVNFEALTGERLKSPYSHGCKTFLEDFYPGMHVLVKRSCFLVENSLSATEEDLAKLLDKEANPEKYAWQESNVLYEDGRLEDYWLTARDDDNAAPPNRVELGMPKVRTGART